MLAARVAADNTCPSESKFLNKKSATANGPDYSSAAR
jgi:hypothetical protein